MKCSIFFVVLTIASSICNASHFAVQGSSSKSDWYSVGGDSLNRRHSSLSQINIDNVKRLKGAWVLDLPTPSRTPPVVVDGRLFINDTNTIYALDPTTGATLWKYTPPNSTPARGGVAVGGGLVYCGLTDAQIVALDAKTGKLQWSGYIGNARPEEVQGPKVVFPGPIPPFYAKVGLVVGAPTYVNGTVITGVSGGDGGARGKVTALDARTGKLRWNFHVIPSPHTAGAESWPDDGKALQHGGGAVWTQGAADAELGLAYYGTGNAVPQLGGEIRAGNNLYTASVVALDVKTGALRWHYQLTHHDLWEMDVATPVVLYQADSSSGRRPGLAVARTDGLVFLLDRKTGVPILPVEERPVAQDSRVRTAPTQPFPVGAIRLGPDCVDPGSAPMGFKLGCWFEPPAADELNTLMPQMTMRQAPMSYDEDTGYLYVFGEVSPVWSRRGKDPFSIALSRPVGSIEHGIYAAIDTRTNRIVWRKESQWGMSGGSGALSTAGGLLFFMEGDGSVRAVNAKTGDPLWGFQTGALGVPGPMGLTGGVPGASFEIAGVQYVSFVSATALWAFKLDGSLAERAAPPAPPRKVGFVGLVRALPDDGSGEIELGRSQSMVESQTDAATEDGFTPIRARVKAGAAFRWTNRGTMPHTVVAEDKSWRSPAIAPGQSVVFRVDRPGAYTFSMSESPWSKGQLVVH